MTIPALRENLRRLRRGAGLTQATLAEQIGTSRTGYQRIERGGAEPPVATLVRIAEVLGVRLADLLSPHRALKAVRFRMPGPGR